eukprot:1119379-Pelagomonas_calceolata.AAC.1
MQPQGPRVALSIFDSNGTSGRGNLPLKLEVFAHIGQWAWSFCASLGIDSVDSPTHTQKDCVESDLITLSCLHSCLCCCCEASDWAPGLKAWTTVRGGTAAAYRPQQTQ